jgi:betaine-aldehyde dehydrogenase
VARTSTSEVPFSKPDRLFIGGEWVRPATTSSFDIVTPATESLYTTVAMAEAEDMERAVAAARKAFDHGPWPRLTHVERAQYLNAIANALAERVDDVGKVWPNEMGILHGMARAGAERAASTYEYYAGLASTFPFEERRPTTAGKLGLLVREPVGVMAAIIPWNAPVSLIAWKLAPALLAGCTVILKGSPEAPGVGYILAEIAEAIELPPGVLNCVTADREASELLVRNPGVDKVSFTGSSAAGRRIASICGERIARNTLELGGKSAAVILEDYDVDVAAEAIVGPACMMAGQVCSSLTRIIVDRKRHDALVDALSARFRAVVVGDPFDPAVQMGPIAMRRQRDRIEALIATGKQEGARLAVGGGRPAHLDRGFFIEPTVFGNVDNRSTLAREEIFGPVLSVIPAESDEHAIDLANDTVYGLNNAVFTNDADRAYAVARRLRSGTVGHNKWRSDFGIAFGGFKQSGIGREGGTEGLLACLETKTILLDGTPSHLA